MPRVFISYSHDSAEHRDWVLSLSERLRQDGIETDIDQYVEGAPEQGWLNWMLDKFDAADRVVVVCTETYYRRFRGHEEPGVGRGVSWEGRAINQHIYDRHSQNKFIAVLPPGCTSDMVPDALRAGNCYALTSDENYQRLLADLNGVSSAEPGPVGKVTPPARRKGTPLTFSDSAMTPASTPAPASTPPPRASSGVLEIWRRKLDFLQKEEAIASDPAQKFTLQERIHEAREKIKELDVP